MPLSFSICSLISPFKASKNVFNKRTGSINASSRPASIGGRQFSIAAPNALFDDDGTLHEQPEPLWLRLRYRVAENGDVTYVKDRKELLDGTGRRLYVLDVGDESGGRGLQMAATMWGGKTELKGISEFIRHAVEVVARKNMSIEFVYSAQNAALQAAKERMRKGMEHTERHRENGRAQAPGQAQTVAQKEKEEEMLSPGKRRPGCSNNGYRCATQIRNKTKTVTATSIYPRDARQCHTEIYVASLQYF
jgi:hypothetical protein